MVDLKKRGMMKKAIAGAVGLVFGASMIKEAMGAVILKDKTSGNEHRFGTHADFAGDVRVKQGQKIVLEGPGSDTYISYNGTNVELYHNNTLVMQWNST